MDEGADKASPYTRVTRFMPTTRQIVQFSEGKSPNVSTSLIAVRS